MMRNKDKLKHLQSVRTLLPGSNSQFHFQLFTLTLTSQIVVSLKQLFSATTFPSHFSPTPEWAPVHGLQLPWGHINFLQAVVWISSPLWSSMGLDFFSLFFFPSFLMRNVLQHFALP